MCQRSKLRVHQLTCRIPISHLERSGKSMMIVRRNSFHGHDGNLNIQRVHQPSVSFPPPTSSFWLKRFWINFTTDCLFVNIWWALIYSGFSTYRKTTRWCNELPRENFPIEISMFLLNRAPARRRTQKATSTRQATCSTLFVLVFENV